MSHDVTEVNNVKIIFMGSAVFAVPSIDAIFSSKHKIIEVVTQPDKPAGRGMKVTACPVAEFARLNNLPLFQPKSVRKPEVIEHFRNLKPDLIVVVAYGRILPIDLLKIPPHGCVNVHASLLPKYRGAAPINWAIINCEEETGVTTQQVVEELDAGDILFSCRTKIDDIMTAKDLHDELAPMGADILIKTIDAIEKGKAKAEPQDKSKVSFAPILKKEDGHIDWMRPAAEIYNRIRGLTPWPGTYATLDGKKLRIHEAAPVDVEHGEAPGTILECDKHLLVACGAGSIYLLEVQAEGKRRMSAKDFLHGHKIRKGTMLK